MCNCVWCVTEIHSKCKPLFSKLQSTQLTPGGGFCHVLQRELAASVCHYQSMCSQSQNLTGDPETLSAWSAIDKSVWQAELPSSSFSFLHNVLCYVIYPRFFLLQSGS